MKINTYKAVFGAVLAAGLACAPLSATPVGAGEFSIAGDLYITTTSILFGLSNTVPPTGQNAIVVPPNTGAFAALTSGTVVGIQNLTSPPNPVTGNITAPTPWITLSSIGIDLNLANVAIPTVPVCTAANNVVGGGSCVAFVGSPVLLSEGSPDAAGMATVNASITLSGTAYSGSSSTGTTPYGGILSQAIPNTTVTGLIATFASQGFFNTEYSGRFVTTPAAVIPEPGTFAALGLGMLVLGSLRKKMRANKSE
jgi:hypothetical protein